jgi:NADPH-dependent 2,4-dienoyl-CoA reductase/sulfur reductase-like enzyme/peroxiredoxin family protein/TusA-related sulfurtransferase/rhodanese-related sulfurtransferase
MGVSMKILIIGGVAGGASAAARLRRLDEKAQIIMLEKGPYVSYANCGLPYYISGTIANKETLIVTEAQLFRDRFNIDVRTMNEVTSIDKDKKQVTIINHETQKEYTEDYDKLILSPGASPKIMFPDAVAYDGVFSLRTVPDTVKIKEYIQKNASKSAVVIGGGFIGIETAENLKEAGLDVTIIEFAPHIIASMDREMTNILHEHLQNKGVSLWLKTGVTKITQNTPNKNASSLHLEVNTGKSIDTDIVIMSVGVNAESGLAEKAGLDLGMRKSISVNEYMQTSNPDIYAVGDAVNIINGITGQEGLIPLAGPANKQGRAVAENVLGAKEKANVSWGSSVLKVFDLTAASTGLSEESLQQNGYTLIRSDKDPKDTKSTKRYHKTYIHTNTHAGYYPGATSLQLKMLFDAKGKILGAQAIGYAGVEKRIDVLATAMQMGATVADLEKLELCYAPPFSSAKDPVNMLGYTANNILKGDMNVWYAEDYEAITEAAKEGKVQLYDSRFEEEHLMGNLENTIDIPLDSLRPNISKLNKDKPTYVFCMVGLRGYVAARQLINNGFKQVYNLSGGFKTLKLIQNTKTTWTAQNSPFLKSLAEERVQAPTQTSNPNAKEISIDARGLACPGPIMKVSKSMKEASNGDNITVEATDPGFLSDIKVWCERTDNTYISGQNDKGAITVKIQKGTGSMQDGTDNNPQATGVGLHANTGLPSSQGNDKSMVVFSGDLDKAIASFIIANGAASMGRNVTMFFTFWGLNILRRPKKVSVKKDFMGKMFGAMLPRGTHKLKLSQMNMGGMGPKMIRNLMKNKNVPSIEELMQSAQEAGVKFVACQMSMDLLGIAEEELIDGVEVGGVATFLGSAESSDTNLFI